jgi:hypothetical protein
MSYGGTFSRGLLANASKSPMKYRNDKKRSKQMQNPFLASRQAEFQRQRDLDQGVSPVEAAPAGDMMGVWTEEDVNITDDLDVGDHDQRVDGRDEMESDSFNRLYDGDTSWITPDLLDTTAPQEEPPAKPKTEREPRRAPKAVEERVKNWEKLLPSLHGPYARYKSRSMGNPNALERHDVIYGGCKGRKCEKDMSKIVTCLFMEGNSTPPAPAGITHPVI